MGVHVVIGEGGGRFQFGGVFVEVPVFAAGDEGVVGVGEAGGQAPGAGVKAAGQVVDLLHGLMADVVVVFELVGDLGHARARHGPQVVIPPVDAFAGFAVVGGPAEIGGVDVGGQAFLKPVQLVGADEVHLAGQGGVVAGAAQVVGVGRDVRGELGGVVIDPGAARQGARHEGGAGGGAKRRGGVGVGKAHRPGGQGAQVRDMQEGGGAVVEERAGQLVDHQDQDIGFVGHRGALGMELASDAPKRHKRTIEKSRDRYMKASSDRGDQP